MKDVNQDAQKCISSSIFLFTIVFVDKDITKIGEV